MTKWSLSVAPSGIPKKSGSDSAASISRKAERGNTEAGTPAWSATVRASIAGVVFKGEALDRRQRCAGAPRAGRTQNTEVPGWDRTDPDRHAHPPCGHPSGVPAHRAAGRDRGMDRRDQTSLTAISPAPLVSIITPTYNHGLYIGRCLESVLAQTEPRWEQIVIDDGSTDGTADVVGRSTDARIRYVSQPHRGITGLGDAYNLALGMARGEYVADSRRRRLLATGQAREAAPCIRGPEGRALVGPRGGDRSDRRRPGASIPAARRSPQASAQDRGPDRQAAARGERHSRMHGGVPNERAACGWWLSPARQASRMSTIRRGSSCAGSGGSHRSTGSWGSTVATITRSP